jgi:hypothetical protein
VHEVCLSVGAGQSKGRAAACKTSTSIVHASGRPQVGIDLACMRELKRAFILLVSLLFSTPRKSFPQALRRARMPQEKTTATQAPSTLAFILMLS